MRVLSTTIHCLSSMLLLFEVKADKERFIFLLITSTILSVEAPFSHFNFNFNLASSFR